MLDIGRVIACRNHFLHGHLLGWQSPNGLGAHLRAGFSNSNGEQTRNTGADQQVPPLHVKGCSRRSCSSFCDGGPAIGFHRVRVKLVHRDRAAIGLNDRQ